MADTHLSDLASVDREVARGAASLARFRADLARDPAASADAQPLEAVRRVTGKATYDALGALSPSLVDLPLRDGLREWVATLLLARVVRDVDVELALSAAEPRGRFAGEPPVLASFVQARRSLVAARTPAEARLWLDTAAQCGPPLAAILRARAEKRLEATRRLGLTHPWELVVPAKHAALRTAAEQLLRATQDLCDAVVRPQLRDGGGPEAVLHAAVARDAGEGWPARLTDRWLLEAFGPALRGLRLDLAPMPAALGASSFARALALFGFAVRGACVGKATPFVLGFEPGARASHRFAGVFASLVLSPEWQVRALGLGQRSAQAQVRVLARTVLLHVRLQAARLLLGDEAALAPRDRFAELGPRLLGGSLDDRLRGVFPYPADDAPARFVALLEARDLANELRERFDLDWYRNPRAWSHLRAIGSLPSRDPVAAAWLETAPGDLARSMEGLLA